MLLVYDAFIIESEKLLSNAFQIIASL